MKAGELILELRSMRGLGFDDETAQAATMLERFIALADELEGTANDTGAKGSERVALEFAAKRIREILEET